MSSSEEQTLGRSRTHVADTKSAVHEVASFREPTSSEFDFTPAQQRRIIRQIDRRLVVTLGCIYCVSLIDRINLSNASIAGMTHDMRLDVGTRFSVMTLVFYISYVFFQPPSVILCRTLGPRLHLSLITLMWGACTIGMGFVNDYRQMTVLRSVLGILEASFSPSCVYLLSTWYTRYEVGKRYAVFFLIGCMAAAFGGILSYGLDKMEGLAGIRGWRWIFIVPGIMTCLLAVIGYWLIIDFPDSRRRNWAFISEREREWVCARVHADRGDVQPQPFLLRKFFVAGADAKLWVMGLIMFNTGTVSYSLAYFMPTILHLQLHFSLDASNCLVAPPYVFAGLVMFICGWLGDRYHVRGPLVALNSLLCVIGLHIVGFHSKPGIRYFGIFLCTAGANANVPSMFTYQANNIRGQRKRAVAGVVFVSFGSIGGIFGSLVFRSQDAATGYKLGLYACIVCSALNLALVAILTTWYYCENRKADRGEKELEMKAEEALTPGFRYTY